MSDSVTPNKGLSAGVKVLLGCGCITLALIVCFIFASMAGLAGVSQVATNIDNQQKADADKEQQDFNNPKKLNEPVIVKDVQWTITEAKDLGATLKSNYSSYGDDCKANSGKFIQVTVKIKNNSKDMASVTDLDLYDSEKNEYKTSSDVFSCVEGDLFILSNINPGIEKTFIGVYEVPATASGFRVKVGDLNLFSNEYTYVSLGF